MVGEENQGQKWVKAGRQSRMTDLTSQSITDVKSTSYVLVLVLRACCSPTSYNDLSKTFLSQSTKRMKVSQVHGLRTDTLGKVTLYHGTISAG